jgi:hypothetical protein
LEVREERRRVLKKVIEAVGPETNDNVVFVGYVAKGGWNASGRRYFQEIKHHLG